MLFSRRKPPRNERTGTTPEAAEAQVSRALLARVHDRATRTLTRLASRARVAELACGTGVLALRLALDHPEMSIVGLDSSTDRIRRAREAAASSGIVERLRFERSDAAHLALPDGAVDVVLGLEPWRDCPSVARFARELDRVLGPGGFALLWASAPEETAPPPELSRLERHFGPRGSWSRPAELGGSVIELRVSAPDPGAR